MSLLLQLVTIVEHVVVAVVVALFVGAWSRGGLLGIAELLASALNCLPGYRVIVSSVIGGQVKNYAKKLRGDESATSTTDVGNYPVVPLPKQGL